MCLLVCVYVAVYIFGKFRRQSNQSKKRHIKRFSKVKRSLAYGNLAKSAGGAALSKRKVEPTYKCQINGIVNICTT